MAWLIISVSLLSLNWQGQYVARLYAKPVRLTLTLVRRQSCAADIFRLSRLVRRMAIGRAPFIKNRTALSC